MTSPPRRFVVLHHDWPSPHHDLMIEDGDACRTWRLLGPLDAASIPIEPLTPHRLAYLTYEGPVSNDRGEVRRIDAGTCIIDAEWVTFVGAVLSGDYRLGPQTLQRSGIG